MGVTSANLVAGPAVVYTGAFGATEPADSAVATAPSSAAWTDQGGTDGGVKINIDLDYFDLSVDQIVDRVGSRLQKREITVETNLAEATLANLKTAINGGTITASAAYQALDPLNDNSATQPAYTAMIIDGFAPLGTGAASASARRRFIVRKVLNTDAVGMSYEKDKQTFIPVKLTAHYVSSAIAPFRVVDQLT
jgi:hypothetical protein